MQLERRIIEHPGQAKAGERRPDRAQQNVLARAAADDETADENIFAGADIFPGRDVELARGVDDRARVVRLGGREELRKVVCPVAIGSAPYFTRVPPVQMSLGQRRCGHNVLFLFSWQAFI